MRLEFLISIHIPLRVLECYCKTNFISDDEGLPTDFASDGNLDSEYNKHIRESFSVHIETFVKKGI
jgi:hypothetical protein